MWISGAPNSGMDWFATEIASRLMSRGLKVKVLTGEQSFNSVGSDIPNSMSHDQIRESCDSVLKEHSAVIVLDNGLDPGFRQLLQRHLAPAIKVSVKRPDAVATQGAGNDNPGRESVVSSSGDSPDFDFVFLMGVESLSASVSELLRLLEENKLLAWSDANPENDEQLLIQRLSELGYL